MAPIARNSRSKTAQLLRPRGEAGSRPTPETFATEPSTSPGPTKPNRTGIVFVHGIGAQPACGTLLDWAGPIVDLLTDWRRDHDKPGDPVIRASCDLTGAQLPCLELDIPDYAGHPAGSWLITEAWWAQSARPPTLATMTRYVGKSLRPIILGICQSYQHRATTWTRQIGVARRYADRETTYDHRRLVLRSLPTRQRDWIFWLDWVQMKLTTLVFIPILLLVPILPFYDPFRRIPIRALQDSATLKSVDDFLTRWFGGLPNVADDKIQSANIRSRLANAIRGLRAQGCDQIVVVAHSGGAIVSFEMLCDRAYLNDPVDKLITLGEGLGLAWRIHNAHKGLPQDSRLRGDLRAVRPNLRWVDFWSTYDPAPAGPIRPPDCVKLVRYQTHVTVNRMSILEDHGSYWDNDEEFLIPLLKDLDTPTGHASGSRFFRDSSLATVRSAWRRTRVGVLAVWRWVATLLAAVTLSLTTVTGMLGIPRMPGPGRLGGDLAGWWRTVPGHEILAGPLDGLAGVASWPPILRDLGEWGIGVAAVAVMFVLLARLGNAYWGRWDLQERQNARRKTPCRPGRLVPAIVFTMLTLAGLAMSILTLAIIWR